MNIINPTKIAEIVQSRNISLLSVDLFDTLIFRACARPDSVFLSQFESIRHLLPGISSATGWAEVRMKTEREITESLHPGEVHLDEIYEKIGAKLGLSAQTVAHMKQTELNTERQFISPFLPVADALRQVRAMGVKVVVNTDTYLPETFIRELLDGIVDAEVPLLCSSATRGPKRTGLAFDVLKKNYPGERILHIGDNQHSDVRMAAENGVDGCLVRWPRGLWLGENKQHTKYRESLGAYRLSTPADAPGATATLRARDEVAWRWAAVLYDFLLSLRKYAKDINADEIWFLSRDCESLYSALEQNRDLFREFTTKYIYTSRAAAYPIFAEKDPAQFARVFDREATEQDARTGRDLISVYRAQVNQDTRRILIVDAGWKGRLQLALQAAMPEKEVYGFYFSLDQLATADVKAKARCFVEWNPGYLNQATVESLFGFEKPTCTGYVKQDDKWIPQFDGIHSDGAPSDYCEHLRHYLSELLAHGSPGLVSEPSAERVRAVRSMCMYPDHVTATAFRNWSASTAVDGGDSCPTIDGGGAGWLYRALGIARDGNIWPAGASWSVASSPLLVRAIQGQMVLRKTIFFAVKKLREKFRGGPDGEQQESCA